ncbi:unnamed protein product [Adineta steineri]|uniref:Ig-like domain-containing protein n=1 Tax=Adineta steineri TaxID=433720 RepID=A0A815IH17_9BILA|nr:unnamed protein product [Adineta steineri]
MINSNNEDNNRFEIIYRTEYEDVNLVCVLNDVAWWKRPNLLATRYGIILPKFRSKMSFEQNNNNVQSQTLYIRQLQSNDSGVYECETLGSIQQFNLTVIVHLTTVELGTQLITSYDSTTDHKLNQTDSNLLQHSIILNNGHIQIHENQLIRLTCVVSRALPAAILYFPFDIDYRIEKNITIENDDKTYRTILVIILRINRHLHKRIFHCQAIQNSKINNGNNQKQLRILSNTLQMDVSYSPICSHKISFLSQFYTGIHRPINLTCHMLNGNPPKNNFTWHLPNGNIRLGHYLNISSSYITIIPNQYTDFGQVTCRAQNELGLFGECHVNMILGGIPDPIKSCHYTYLNSTLTVNCVAGYHQGDEDFFCYMYKRQKNGSYSEHARLKGNCAFILPDLKPELYHDFQVFTKNKYGDNYERSYSIKVGKPKVDIFTEKARIYWPYLALFVIGACLGSLVLICCSCHKMRKSMHNKRKATENFENLTYQNHDSHHSHSNSNGKMSFVHLKQNGNGTTYPVRPYRSKDHLISYESSTLYRNNPQFKSMYSTDDDVISSRRNTFKETDLDHPLNVSNDQLNGTIKTLPINRNRTLLSTFDSQQDQLNETNQIPVAMQRRSSFQTATKLNNLDFYTTQESFYFLDKQIIKPSQRNHYSPEHYRDKNSPYLKTDQNNLIVENTMLINTKNEQQIREINPLNEFTRDNFKDTKKFILNNNHHSKEERKLDDGIFV